MSGNYSIRSIAGSYVSELQSLLDGVDLMAIEAACQTLRSARDRHATIFIAGNGGSAATAAHWVNDLGKATKRSGRDPFRVLSLCDNVSWLTALGNDEGYERTFAGQLENFAEPGDILIVISASGNSANLIKAAELARNRHMTVIALLGFDGGKLLALADRVILVATEPGAYELVEDVHSIMAHTLTKCLIADVVRHDAAAAAVEPVDVYASL